MSRAAVVLVKPVEKMPSAFRTDKADAFAGYVTAAIEGGTLRYSQRQRLLRQADAMAIDPFEANLIIAIVQNSHVMPSPIEERPAQPGRMPTLLLFGLIEMAIAAVILIILKW